MAADLPAEIVSVFKTIALPEVAPIVTQHQRLAVRCPSCGTRVVAAVPEAARSTPFGPRLHAVTTYLKTFQALSYERLQAALADLFGLIDGLHGGLHDFNKSLRPGEYLSSGEYWRLMRAMVPVANFPGVLQLLNLSSRGYPAH